MYLYQQGFPQPLSHIQTGNIFVSFTREEKGGEEEEEEEEEEGKGAMIDLKMCCQLGGYENTLLGYRPRLYKAIKSAGKLKRMDIVLFGHVIYEMVCGRELSGVEPMEADYAAIDSSDLQKLLKNIFSLDMDSSAGMTEVCVH